ncbi:unnamed protein product [Brassicogethes aeneus]|uniref:HotDog ACOT-type domain-containing protein n=1 Tax=Brassicogethes aeneus TaxID=1431903 RepID=A0A9P0B8U0_BRAAE|nr:unnamed protein product [Brassicogethes aeneus]
MEVVVWLEQKLHGSWHRITRALFLIAARDPTNTRSALVNPLEPADERERSILAGGESRKTARMKLQAQHVSKVIPNEEEQRIIHNLYTNTVDVKEGSLTRRVLPPSTEWMSNCTLSNVIFSHPEDRNLHNTVFGGFIMRNASELAFILGFRFSRYRPMMKSISDINFQRPIAVNSLIQMHAHVVFTQLQYMQIIVYVETYDPINGRSDTTNTFHFTFQVPEIVREVLPLTYHEAMMYIDGRRHFQDVLEKDLNDSMNTDIPELMSKL